MMHIAMSELVRQTQEGVAVMEPAYNSMRNNENPPVLLWFHGIDQYADGWFNMRLWVKVDEFGGFLCDSKCNYYLERDIPLQEFYERMREFYVMSRMMTDHFDQPYIYGASPHASRLDLVRNRLNLSIGYYSLGARLIRSNEERP
jgi:hypothetical protein